MTTKLIGVGLIGLLAGGALAIGGRAVPPGEIAVVSVQRVLNGSAAGRAQMAKLQQWRQQKATELQAKQQELNTTQQQLATASPGADRTRLATAEQQQRVDIEKLAATDQADFQQLQQQVNKELQDQIGSALADLVRETNIRAVLPSETAVLWSSPELDLTTAVVDRLNKTPPAQ